MPRIYAYVPRESCRGLVESLPKSACLPGTLIDGKIPVSRHNDWKPWLHGKKMTNSLARDYSSSGYYMARCANAVMKLLGWRYTKR